MSSYHTSFTYLNGNSRAEGFIVCAFDADNGLSDTNLGVDQIYTDSYNGAHRHLYGTKYNSVATITITIIKPDGSDLSMAENRRLLKWLTGSRQASWLDLYVGDKLQYSFYCTTLNVQQYKLDSRVVGLTITFESIHPWAWSALKSIHVDVGEEPVEVFEIDNQSDDLYTYTNVDVTFSNANIDDRCSTTFSINNLTLNELTTVNNIKPNEIVQLSANQFITSDNSTRIFGDDFNWTWPRLAPGINNLLITADGKGHVDFIYRYPIKIGDCAMDLDGIDYDPSVEGEISGAINSTSGVTTLGRKNVILIDKSTGMSYAVFMKNSYLHISETSATRKQYSFAFEDETKNIVREISISEGSLYISTNVKDNIGAGKDHSYIVLVDEVTSVPYKVAVNNDRLYFVEL